MRFFSPRASDTAEEAVDDWSGSGEEHQRETQSGDEENNSRTNRQGSMWDTIHEVAGQAGVEPGNHTFGELVRMAAGRWDHTIALQNMWRSEKSKPIPNPYRKAVKIGIPIEVADLKTLWENLGK